MYKNITIRTWQKKHLPLTIILNSLRGYARNPKTKRNDVRANARVLTQNNITLKTYTKLKVFL